MPSTDSELFDDLYRAEFGRLAGALRLVTGDRMTADELAQETFVRAWQHWRRVSALERPAGWLYTTGFRLARRAGRRARVGVVVDAVAADRPVAGPEGDTVERLRFEQALATLPLRQRQAVVARHVLGLSTHEAAGVMGLSPEALRQLLRRGVATLRQSPTFAEGR